MIRKIFSLFLLILFTLTLVNAAVYNKQGDFQVEINSLKQTVFNNDMNSVFVFKVQNLKDTTQNFKITLPTIKGWDIQTASEVFVLEPRETKDIRVSFVANSEFDYLTDLVSPDVIRISQKEDYKGYFEFPIKISGEKQDVSMKFQLEIEKKEIEPISFSGKFSQEKLSPVSPIRYTITAENLLNEQEVEVTTEFNGVILNRFKETFSEDKDYKIFQADIPSSFNPGVYDGRLTIRILKEDGKSAQEWYENKKLEIVSYEKILVERIYENTFLGDKYSIVLNNTGNVKSIFTEEIETNLFTKTFLSSNYKSVKTDDGIKFDISLEKGESTTLYYSYNYMFVYLVFIILAFVAGHFYMKSQSNPLRVDSKVYDVKRVEHEGIKSLRVKVDFENIKLEQIDELRLVFKMPAYLYIKEGSFLLVEPNHVLKGKEFYKLIWDFKKFEKTDSRIIGFTVINQRGVLGDINLPDIEFEVKVDGKTTKYYEELPIIVHK